MYLVLHFFLVIWVILVKSSLSPFKKKKKEKNENLKKDIEPKCKIPKAETVEGGVLWGWGANISKPQCSRNVDFIEDFHTIIAIWK